MNPSPFRLEKREILRGYQTFSRVITEGQSLQRGAIRCFFVVEPRNRCMRVGFSVSKSTQNAVDRNRVRRWMREAYRKNKAVLSRASFVVGGAPSLVFMVKVPRNVPRPREFRTAIDQAIIGILNDLNQRLAARP